jgi:exodeoxyribonuclease V alpha subunit
MAFGIRLKRRSMFLRPYTYCSTAMPQRNLLYTGVTRGRKLVVLVGQRKAVAIAVRNASGRRRWTRLRRVLAAGF